MATGYRSRRYETASGRAVFLQTDPIRFSAGDRNIYRYCGNNPVGFIDPLGMDVWVENTTAVNGWHQRVSYTDPSEPTGSNGQSFGMNSDKADGSSSASGQNPEPGKSGSGIVYQDNTDASTKEVERYKTTPTEDQLIKDSLSNELGNTGPYNPLTNNCRDYSKDAFNRMKNMIEELRKNNENSGDDESGDGVSKNGKCS